MFIKEKDYKRNELHKKYGGNPQSGISDCAQHPIIFIFSGETGEKHGYEDGWDDEKYFWYTGSGQHIHGDMKFKKGNKSLRDHEINQKEVFLFEKTKNVGYWKFIDELKLVDYVWFLINWEEDGRKRTRRGIKFKFISVTYASEVETPSGPKDNKMRYNHNEPGVTERRGLVTTRIGQGAYRKDVLEKWRNKCGVTGSNIKKILIASHIVPWSKSNNRERKDVENGILLSPNIDALFDKYLISFKDSGDIIISKNINHDELEHLGINENMKLSQVSDGMKSYLSRHRKTFNENNK